MKFTATFLFVLLPLCSALEPPKQFVRKLQTEQDLQSRVSALAVLANHQDVNQSRQLQICTSCESFSADYKDKEEEKEEEKDGIIKTALTTATSLLGDGSIFSTLKDTLLSAAEGALGEEITVETLLPILVLAGAQFAALVLSTQQMSSDAAVSADTSDLVIAIFDIITSIIIAIANLILSIVDLLRDIKVAIVGLIVGIIISILNLIENIILAIIDIIVSFLNAIFGNAAISASETATSKLQDLLSDGALGGIFSEVKGFLMDSGDVSGLKAVLDESTTDLESVEDKLTALVDSVESLNAGAESTDVAIQSDTIIQILDLIVSIIVSIINLVVSIIVGVLNLIVNIITAVLSLILSIITAIINIIFSILNAILGIFSVEAVRVLSNTYIVAAILTSISPVNLEELAACALDLPLCPDVSAEEITCRMEELSCQSDAAALLVGTRA